MPQASPNDHGSPLTVRPLGWDDAAASRRLGQEAFGVPTTPPPDPETWPPPGNHPVGSFDGDRLVARVIGREYQSWFGGVQIPTWGIAGVTVEAEYRGRKALSALFAATFEQARSWGAVLSTLYPTAAGIYRPFGYEVVGDYVTVEIPSHVLGRVRGDTACVRRASAADVPAIQQVYQQWASAQNGPLSRTGPNFTDTADAFVAEFTGVSVAVDDDDRVVGFASWERGQGYDKTTGRIDVSDLIALTPAATRSLLKVVGSFTSVTAHVRVDSSGYDLGALELPGKPWRAVKHDDYMLRVVDPVAAIELRSYPRLLSGTVSFRLVDSALPENTGGYRVEVANGRAVCTRTVARTDAGTDTAGGPELTARGLALLFTSTQSLTNLRRAGQAIGGDPAADADLDALFAGRQLHIRDYF